MTYVICHRGFHKECRENTLDAFKSAIKLRGDYVEFDLRKTKDGKIVVHHDQRVGRKLISKLNYIDANKLAAKHKYRVPLYEEVLKTVKGKIKCDIELKEVGYEKEVLRLTKKYLKHDEFFFTSFKDNALINMKKIDPNIKVGLLIGAYLFSIMDKIEKNKAESKLLTRLKNIDADYLVTHTRLFKNNHIQFVYPKYQIIIWGENKPTELFNYMKNKTVSGIITDNPDFVVN